MKGEQKEARECYNTSLRMPINPSVPMEMVVHEGTNLHELDPRVVEEPRAEPVEELEEVTVMN